MGAYRPNGRGHGTLALLRDGPENYGRLLIAYGANSRSRRSRLWNLISAHVRHGFVISVRGEYDLTPTGRQALATLDAGRRVEVEEEPQTSVRVFAQPERRAA